MIFETKNKLDVYKYRWVFLLISAIIIVPGIVAMIYSSIIYNTHSPFRLGIDFTGGTITQYSIDTSVSPESIDILRDKLLKNGFENPVIQNISTHSLAESKSKAVVEKKMKSIVSIKTQFLEQNDIDKVNTIVSGVYKDNKLVQVSSIGPTLGSELFKNSLVAVCLAFAVIVLYLAMRFQFDYAMIALFSLIHDALFVCGVFSIMGLVWGTQIDSLFITAILTVVGFSVHDTIVVYDRIRENTKYLIKKSSFKDIVNVSVNQTLARSINTSLTLIITLLALFIFGGVTTREFVFAMLLGTTVGTYSSIFFASVLLAMHRTKKPA